MAEPARPDLPAAPVAGDLTVTRHRRVTFAIA